MFTGCSYGLVHSRCDFFRGKTAGEGLDHFHKTVSKVANVFGTRMEPELKISQILSLGVGGRHPVKSRAHTVFLIVQKCIFQILQEYYHSDKN